MKHGRFYLVTALAMFLTTGLSSTPVQAAQATKTYVARLVSLNAKVTGRRVSGELRLRVSDNTLNITLHAHGLSPGMMHMVHLHGFVSGKAASCPGRDADTNHDGIIDLNETESMAGVTLVPLNNDPAALKIGSMTYPVASKDGRICYRQTVSLARLNQALAATFHGASLDLDTRVVFIHGVPDTTSLPKTVASLPGVPAQVTLPIACGKIVPAR